MNLVELERKLIAAARQHTPSDQVPYAFEKRVMAHLKTLPGMDSCVFWARALWRAAGACVGVSVLLTAVALFAPEFSHSRSTTDLSLDFEKTLLASVNQDTDFSR